MEWQQYYKYYMKTAKNVRNTKRENFNKILM